SRNRRRPPAAMAGTARWPPPQPPTPALCETREGNGCWLSLLREGKATWRKSRSRKRPRIPPAARERPLPAGSAGPSPKDLFVEGRQRELRNSTRLLISNLSLMTAEPGEKDDGAAVKRRTAGPAKRRLRTTRIASPGTASPPRSTG